MVVCQNMFHLGLHNTYIQPNPLKKLSRAGSGWALFMPKTLLELIDVNPEFDMLKIQVENNTIKITKAEEEEEEEDK